MTPYKQAEDVRTKAKSALDDQLYSSHLLHLWRRGAAMLSYCADEDEFDEVSHTCFFLIKYFYFISNPQVRISRKVSLH